MNLKIIIGGLYRGYKYIIETPYRMRAISESSQKKEHILSKKKNRKSEKIKVGFVVQMPEVWDKEAPLFEAMMDDNRFDVYLIIIPHYNFANSKLEQYGEEKKYFVEKYPMAKTVLLINEKDMVVDESYDYIFYQRCWEDYMPEQLRCKNVINYAMTCYIPYFYHCAPVPKAYYHKDFFWYLSKFYTCSEDQYKEVRRLHTIECQYNGFPVFDSIRFIEKKENIKVLWTPRWSDDSTYGGTSFNKNRNSILKLKEIFENVDLVLRPHPLTFENAIKERWMTQSEVEDYKKAVIECGAEFDKNKLIESTFVDTDILITDFTSAIITFYLSGKPIIYCGDTNIKMTGLFKKIIETSYVAKEWDEVVKYVFDIINGKDDLLEKRKEVIDSMSDTLSSSESIMNDLYTTIRFK